MSKRALRYQSAADMPPGMRKLHERQQAGNPASAPGWVPGGAAAKRGSKYAAQPTEVDGIRFDSKAEAGYYQKLKARVAAGAVAFFTRQTAFHLPGNVRYVADFVEHLPCTCGGCSCQRVRVVDVKGVQTAMFKTKKRQVEALYPIKIEIEK